MISLKEKKIKAPMTEWSTTGTALNDWAIMIVY
jgi:hypothetical protein